MTVGRVRGAAILVLIFTLAVLAYAANLSAPNREPGAPVVALRGDDPAPRIVVVGVPGWSWQDINDQTPALQGIETQDASGSLVVRGTYPLTCPGDGWLTLGAGQRAAIDDDDDHSRCAVDPAGLLKARPDGQATLPDFAGWQDAADASSLQAQLGLLQQGLAERGQCAAAYGPLAALAAADQRGVVPSYASQGLADIDAAPTPVRKSECAVVLIDGSGLGPVELDDRVAELEASLPAQTVLVLAGLSDGSDAPALHPVLLKTVPGADAAPAKVGPRALWSASTRQFGLVQTADLTTTLLAPFPVSGDEPTGGTVQATGAVITSADGGEVDLVETNRDRAGAATLATRVQGGYAATMAVLLAAALVGSGVWLRLAPSHTVRQRAGLALSVSGSALMAFPVSAFAASALPWWRFGADPASTDPSIVGLVRPTLALITATVLIGAIILGVAWAAYRYAVPHPLIPVAIIASMTMLLLGVDVVRGGGLGLISVLGVQPVAAGRFYGMGNIAFGIFSAAALILAGCLASMLYAGRGRGRWFGVGAVLLIGLTATAIDGWPDWGADFGGVPAMLVGTGLLAMAAAGRQVKPSVVFLLVIIAAAGGGVLMVADWLRPEAERSHLGNFVQAVLDGQAWQIVTRKLDQSLGILLDYPASWLAVAALGAAVYAVFARRSRLSRAMRPLWDEPLMHACAGALIAVWVLGWVLNDSGISVVALGLTVAGGTAVCVCARGRSGRRDIAGPGAVEHASPSR